jgi:hypothetical protein
MPYAINKSNGDLLVTVEDGTADLTSTSIALVGRNYAGYGEYLNENMVHLLENFAKSTQPSSPLIGQLWYDTTTKLLKVYDGTTFVSSGGGVELNTTSIVTHYFTFIENEFGLPVTKTSKEKGLSFQPNTGNFAINKNTAGTSRLEINNGARTRSLNATLPGTVMHLHSEEGNEVRVLLDGYTGSLTTSPTMTFRRGPTVGQSGAAFSSQLGSIIGAITARGHTGTAFTSDRGAIRFVTSQTWTSAGNGTKIEFLGTQDGTLVTEVKATIHGNGDFEATGDIIGFSLSDEKLKTNITKIDNALDKIQQLEGILYNWNELAVKLGKDTTIRETGLKASQVQQVLPEAVKEKANGMLAVNYEKMMGLVVEAIKELKQEVQLIKAKTA